MTDEKFVIGSLVFEYFSSLQQLLETRSHRSEMMVFDKSIDLWLIDLIQRKVYVRNLFL